jgi:hypothetical protein
MTKKERDELNNRLLKEAEDDLVEKKKKLFNHVQSQQPHVYTTEDPTEQPMGSIYRRKGVEIKGELWAEPGRMTREEFKRA